MKKDAVTLHCGDCLDVLASLRPNSIDACVTDPPYHLTSIVKRFGGKNAAPAKFGTDGAYARASTGFMGKAWDGGDIAFRPELWREVFRVLKPGGHILAFGGTRTYHRMACAIEDAGFEIRDCCMWITGQGFPKSLNASKILRDAQECCTCDADVRSVRNGVEADDALSGRAEQDLLAEVRSGFRESHQDGARPPGRNARGQAASSVCGMREDVLAQCEMARQESTSGLLAPVQRGFSRTRLGKTRAQRERGKKPGELQKRRTKNDRFAQSSLERRRDVPEASRQLRQRKIRSLPASANLNGAQRRLCDGASHDNGGTNRPPASANGMRPPHRPSAVKQPADKSGTMAVQPQPQKRGAWDHCGRCGKPIIPEGLGTALKPANEPICLARKPLSEKTLAANVLKWGCGALNVDGCRVETDDGISNHARSADAALSKGIYGNSRGQETHKTNGQALGRWPANLIHDGSEEVVRAFPSPHGSGAARAGSSNPRAAKHDPTSYSITRNTGNVFRIGDSGSAARFFYCAKASKKDRAGSKHPTVKPIKLIRYLIRLITPPKGVVLDPFAGTGTTGEAAVLEGARAVLIEREREYIRDIRRRIGKRGMTAMPHDRIAA